MNYGAYRNYCFRPDRAYDMSNTKLTPDRLYILDSLSDQCVDLPGEFAECGVWLGGSARVLLKNRPLHLFDTFGGMPDNDDPSGLMKGAFGDTSLDLVMEYLGNPNSVMYHVGCIPETFSDLEDVKYSFVHIDVDLYQSTKDCLDYFLPRMVPGGIIVFDDYGFPDYKDSEKKAVDERIKVTALPTGQAIYIHR